jgi:hypothetical protein
LRYDIACLGGSKKITGDRRICLGHAAIKFVTKLFPQRFCCTTDDPGDIFLRDAKTG